MPRSNSCHLHDFSRLCSGNEKVNGIITDKGGQTSHAAIVSRELGVPCVVGTKTATKDLKEGEIVTLNGATGEILERKFKTPQPILLPPGHLPTTNPEKPPLNFFLNLGEPELAKTMSQKNVDGISLLRAEFMITNIGIHPKMIAENKKNNI